MSHVSNDFIRRLAVASIPSRSLNIYIHMCVYTSVCYWSPLFSFDLLQSLLMIASVVLRACVCVQQKISATSVDWLFLAYFLVHIHTLSLTHTHTTHTHSLSLSSWPRHHICRLPLRSIPCHSHTHPLYLTHTLFLSLFLSLCLSLFLSVSLSLSHTHTVLHQEMGTTSVD